VSAARLTPREIAAQIMADNAWSRTEYVRARDYDALRVRHGRLLEALEEIASGGGYMQDRRTANAAIERDRQRAREMLTWKPKVPR
jgi:hypothetical protein